jgi:hypothetical protein
MPIATSKPLRLMNSVQVRSSSLAQVAYDHRRALLQVEFRDGRAYQYSSVPRSTYRDLLGAGSKGAYFNHHIRNCFPHVALQTETPPAAG